jgi:hypothetical protein
MIWVMRLVENFEESIDDKYKNGKIYKITFDNNIYIGSTYRTLDERFDEHKKASRGSLFVETLKKNKDNLYKYVNTPNNNVELGYPLQYATLENNEENIRLLLDAFKSGKNIL